MIILNRRQFRVAGVAKMIRLEAVHREDKCYGVPIYIPTSMFPLVQIGDQLDRVTFMDNDGKKVSRWELVS